MRELWGGPRRGKPAARRRGPLDRAARLLLGIGLSAAAILAATPQGLANPKGGQVATGSATITNSSPVQLDITQSTNRATIDWSSFDIAVGERTNFVQPSSAAVTLNRVNAANPSTIAGQLTANGSLILINPNGVVFSRGSQVNVNSIIATPSDISNANFMAGNLRFDRPSPNPNARIVNAGTITVAQKGLAALVAPSVVNSGVIQARLGKVVLAGAQTYTLDFYGDGLINFDVGPKVTAVPLGVDGKPVTSLVSNSGAIDAPGGTVLLTADAVAGILANVIDSPGQIAAQTTGQAPGTVTIGTVTIDAGAGNGARLAGTIDVSGEGPGQTGGAAIVTGGAVALASTAKVKAQGPAGGGTVRIGGGPHGTDASVRNAQNTTVDPGALIDTSATDNGNGGNVAVWSDGTTVFNGTIYAKGGPNGGNGGWVETSGHGILDVGATTLVDVGAPIGSAGSWLLDPNSNIDITTTTSHVTCSGSPEVCSPTADSSTLNAAMIANSLNAGTSVTVTTSNAAGTQPGDITVNSPISSTSLSLTTLTLNAAGNIAINAAITDNGVLKSLALIAGGTVTQSGSGVISLAKGTLSGTSVGGATLTLANSVVRFGPWSNTGSGNLSFTNGVTATSGTISDTAGNITLTCTNVGNCLNLNNNVTATGNTVTLNASGVINQIAGAISAATLTTSSAGGTTLNDANTVGTFNATNTTSGDISLTNTAGTLLVSGVSQSGGGGVTIANTGNVVLTGNITDAAGIVTLTASGAIDDAGATQVITAGTLTGSSGTGVVLTDGNLVGTLGPFTNTTSGNLFYTNAKSLATAGLVTNSANTGTLALNVTNGGTLTIGGSGVTSTNGAITLTADAMSIGAPVNAGTARVTLTPNTAGVAIDLGPGPAGVLDLTQASLNEVTAGVLQIGSNTAGNLTVTAPIAPTGSNVLALVTGGTVSETPAGTLTVPDLRISSSGAVTLDNPGNAIQVLAAVAASSVTVVDGVNLTIGVVDGDSGIIPGVGASVNVTSSGTISETGGALVDTTGTLTTSSVGGTTLGNANTVGAFNATNITAGNISLTNTAGTLLVSGVSQSGGGSVTIANTGNVVLTGNITDAAGIVTLTASGSFTESGSTQVITAGTLTGSSGTGVTEDLANLVGTLGPWSNTTSGNLTFGNAQSLATSGTIGNSAAGGTTTLDVTNGGTLTVGGNITTSNGAITLAADAMVINSAVNAGAARVTLTPFTAGQAIDLGPGPAGVLDLTQASLNEVTAGVLQIGSNTAGNLTITAPIAAPAGWNVLSLVNNGTIGEGGGASLTVPDLRISSTGPVTLNNAGNAIPVLAASTTGAISVFNGANLTIGVVDGTSGISTSGGAAVTLNSSGTISEGGGAVVSTTGTLSGSSVGGASLTNANLVGIFGPWSNTGSGLLSFTDAQALVTAETISSVGNLTLTTTGASSDLTVGGNVTASGNTVTLTSGRAIIETGGTITAATLQALASTDIGQGTALQTQVGTLGATAGTAGSGSINIANGVTTPVTLAIAGLSATNAAGGTITLTNNGTIDILTSGQVITATGTISVTATGATADLAAGGQPAAGAAITSNTGAVLLTAGEDILLGNAAGVGSVGAAAGITLQAGRDITLDANATVTNTSSGNLTATAGRNITMLTTPGSLANAPEFVNNASAGTIALTAGSAATLTLDSTAANAVVSNNGTITLAADAMVINKGVNAGTARVVLTPATAGVAINVGSGNSAFVLGLTQAELDEVTASVLQIGSPTASNLQITAPIAAPGTWNVLSLVTGGVVLETPAGSLTVPDLRVSATGSVTLNSSNNVIQAFADSSSAVSLIDAAALTIGTVDGVIGVTTTGDIALTTTGAGNNLTISSPISAPGRTVTLVSAGGITEAPPISTGSLSITAVGPVSMADANQVTTLAASVTGAGNSFLFRNDSLDLTIGTVGSLSGVATNGGAITLETTTSGNLILAGPVNAGAATVTLTSVGTILQTAGVITAATLTGSSASGASLTDANLVGTFGPFANTTGGDLSFTNGQALATSGTLSSSNNITLTTTSGGLTLGGNIQAANVLTLTSAGTISQTGGVITAPHLTGSSVGGTSLTQANLVINLGLFTNTGAGGFSLTNGEALGTSGTINAGTGNLTLTTMVGGLSLGADLVASGNTVTLTSAGTITQSSGVITAATLTGGSVGGASLTDANLVTTFGPFSNTTSGLLSFTDNQTLAAAGTISSAGDLTLTTIAGNLVLGTSILDTINGGVITLNSAGTITQAATGIVDPNSLLIQSVGSVSLTGNNTVDLLAARITGLGSSLAFNDTATTLAVDTVSGVSGIQTNGGSVTLSTTTSGSITLNQAIVASGAAAIPTVTLTSAGAISEPLSTGTITATNLTGSAVGAASLSQANAVGNLGNFTTGGAFTLDNTVALTQTGGTTVNAGAGAIFIDNGGAAFTQSGTLTTTNATAAAVTIQNTAALAVGTINAASGGVLLGTAAKTVGATTETGIITATTLSVADSGGNAVLETANAVGTVAANLTFAGGTFSFNDPTTPLVVGIVNGLGGITTSNGDVNLRSAGLAINQAVAVGTGTVRLVDAGAISQATPGTVTAAGLSVSDTTGNVVLELGNAVGTVALSLTGAGEAFSFNDGTTALSVGSVAAAAAGADPSGLFPAVAGATTNNGDVNLKSAGLAINQAIAVGTGTVRLVDDGAISQAAAGPITASALSVTDSVGNVALEAANAVPTVAANVTSAGGAFSFSDGPTALTFGTVAAAASAADPSALFPAVSNLVTSNGDINLKTAGLVINQPLNAGKGNVRLVESGAVSQTAPITASALSVSDTTGNVVLELANAVGTVAVSLTGPGEAFSFNDGTIALSVGSVAAASAGADPSGLFPAVAGATTNGGDVNLKSAGLAINQAIAVGTGTVRLVDDGAISQAAVGPITASALSVTDDVGSVVLEATNAVPMVAAIVPSFFSAFSFNDGTTALTIGTVAAAASAADPSALFPAVSNLVTNNGDINLKSAGLAINQRLDAGTGIVRLVESGAISQNATTGAIAAGALSVSDTTGNVVLELANAVGTVAVSLTGPGEAFSFNDSATQEIAPTVSAHPCLCPLAVGSVAAAATAADPSRLFLAVAGATTNNGDVNLKSNGLLINQAIAVGTGTVRLVDAGAISQNTTTGAITAGSLSVTDTGGQVVLEAANAVDTVAASLTNAGSAFTFNDTAVGLLTVGSVVSATTSNAGSDPSGLFPFVINAQTSNGDINLKSSSLFLFNALVAGTGTVRLVDNGTISGTGPGVITAGALSVSDSSGSVVLEAFATAVPTVAASLTSAGGAFSFNDDRTALTFGTIGAAALAADPSGLFPAVAGGITTSNGDINLKSAGLVVNFPLNAGTASVRLVDTGAISQTTPGTITAANLSVSDTIGNVALELATNDVTGTLAVSLSGTGEAFSFNDSGYVGLPVLTVGTVASASATIAQSDPVNLFPQIVGATTNNGDVNVKSNGLAINQAIAVGSGNVRLVDTRAVSQAAAGTITAGSLSVIDTGDQVVLEAANAVGTVAASLTSAAGTFSFNDGATALTVGSVGAATAGADPSGLFAAVTGIATNSGDINLKSGGLTLTNAVGAGSATVRLVESGAISQAATGAITAGALSVTDSGGQVVLEATNAVGTVAGTIAANFTTLGSAFSFNDGATALTVGSVGTASVGADPSGLFGALAGIATTTGDVYLKSGGLTLTNAIAAGSGTVRLVESGAVSQAAGGAITAFQLSLTDTVGNVVLEAANEVPTLALSLTGSGEAFSFNDGATALTVGSVAAAAAGADPSALFPAVGNVTTANGDVNLRSGGLAIDQLLNVGSATVRLVESGSVSQNTSTGAITAGSLSVMDSSGQVVLEATNAVGTVAASLTTPGIAFSFNDGTTALTVGSVGAAAAGEDPAPLFGAVTGIAGNGGDVNLRSGALTLANAVNVGNGIVLLVANGAISQAAGGAITANSLSVTDTLGNVVLEAANAVGSVVASVRSTFAIPTVAVRLTGPGEAFSFNDPATLLTVGTVLGAPAGSDPLGLFGAVTGIATNNGDVNLKSAGLTLVNAVGVGNATVRLVESGDVSQAVAGSITAGSLSIKDSNGAVILDDSNLVEVLAGNSTGVFRFTDSGGLTVGTVAAAPNAVDPSSLFPGVTGVATTAGDIRIRTIGGDLTLAANVNAGNGANNAALVAAGNLTEAGGATITANGLTANAGAGVTANSLNSVGTLTGTAAGGSFSFTNAQALTIGADGAIADVAPQSGVTAAQDVVLTTTSGALTALADITATAGNLKATADNGAIDAVGTIGLTAGRNIVLASNGAFTQSGTLTIASPDLVIDTTGKDASLLLAQLLNSPGANGITITDRAVITDAAFGPSGNSNPITFGGALAARNSIVLLLANAGAITGGSSSSPAVTVGQLGVSGTGGLASLFGSIGGNATTTAAQLGRINPGPDNNYRFNDCVIGSATCVVLPGITPIRPQAAQQVDILVARPSEEDIDAPLINIFDEERVCEELLRTDPKRAKEVCQ